MFLGNRGEGLDIFGSVLALRVRSNDESDNRHGTDSISNQHVVVRLAVRHVLGGLGEGIADDEHSRLVMSALDLIYPA